MREVARLWPRRHSLLVCLLTLPNVMALMRGQSSLAHARLPSSLAHAPLRMQRCATNWDTPELAVFTQRQVPEERWQPQVRPPYTLTGLRRPEWRGRKMGWLHRTRAWYLICIAYVLLAWQLPTPTPLTGFELSLRVSAAVASSANIWISDGYHNGDQRALATQRAKAYSREAELFWLRLDYVGISSVLTSLLWLWSANTGWVARLRATGVVSGLCTALIAVLSCTVVPRRMGHRSVKCIMALQFVVLLGYLCWFAVLSAPAACLWNTIVFWIYAPGLILYVLKKPQSPTFGFHEWFHTSVLVGHLSSMALDLRSVVSPWARGV